MILYRTEREVRTITRHHRGGSAKCGTVETTGRSRHCARLHPFSLASEKQNQKIATLGTPTGNKHTHPPPSAGLPQSPNQPLGRVSARLLLILILILIFRPLRQAEWRDSSGGQARSAVWRSQTHREEVQRSKPEAMRPDGSRSEGTPSPSERAERRGKPFFAYFFEAFVKKVSRRKGETASRHTRSNGYSHTPDQSMVGPKAAKITGPTAEAQATSPPPPTPSPQETKDKKPTRASPPSSC